MEMEDRFKWKLVVIVILSVLILISLGYLSFLRIQKGKEGNPAGTPAPSVVTVTAEPVSTDAPETTEVPEQTAEPEETPVVEMDNTADDSLTKVVNKNHPISADYAPTDLVLVDVRSDTDQYLRKECAEQIERLFADGIDQNIYFKLISGYRSYEDQARSEEYYVNVYGADAVAGMDCHPGTSEHQLGLAVDLGNWNSQCDLDVCYSWYPTYLYLVEHGHEYGLIERYPEGSSAITGYDDACWHWRYVGVEEATKIHESGKTMEEYYGIH